MKKFSFFCGIGCLLFLLFGLSCTKNNTPNKPTPPDSIPVVGTSSFTEDDYTLVFTNTDSGFDTTIRTKLVQTFFKVYPAEVDRFNPNSSDTVHFLIDTAYSGVAATGGSQVRFSAAYYQAHPNDIDVVTHEVMHIVQNYPQYKPVWLVEGIADFARYIFGVDNANAGWSLPDYSPDQHYTDSYRVTARFLVWLENHKDKKIVDQLDKSLRNESYYNKDVWKNVTGKTLDQLWEEYTVNPSL